MRRRHNLERFIETETSWSKNQHTKDISISSQWSIISKELMIEKLSWIRSKQANQRTFNSTSQESFLWNSFHKDILLNNQTPTQLLRAPLISIKMILSLTKKLSIVRYYLNQPLNFIEIRVLYLIKDSPLLSNKKISIIVMLWRQRCNFTP